MVYFLGGKLKELKFHLSNIFCLKVKILNTALLWPFFPEVSLEVLPKQPYIGKEFLLEAYMRYKWRYLILIRNYLWQFIYKNICRWLPTNISFEGIFLWKFAQGTCGDTLHTCQRFTFGSLHEISMNILLNWSLLDGIYFWKFSECSCRQRHIVIQVPNAIGKMYVENPKLFQVSSGICLQERIMFQMFGVLDFTWHCIQLTLFETLFNWHYLRLHPLGFTWGCAFNWLYLRVRPISFLWNWLPVNLPGAAFQENSLRLHWFFFASVIWESVRLRNIYKIWRDPYSYFYEILTKSVQTSYALLMHFWCTFKSSWTFSKSSWTFAKSSWTFWKCIKSASKVHQKRIKSASKVHQKIKHFSSCGQGCLKSSRWKQD